MFAPVKTIAIVAFATLSLAAGSASAETFQSNGRTSEVRFGDLDLSRQADQKVLDARIARAASKVCSARDLSETMMCRSAAIAQVRAPVAAAIARANSKERYAEVGKEARPDLSH